MIPQKIVLVTGVFDILHTKHLEFLSDAKKCGDVLIVAVETDKRVRQMKGEGRPYNSQDVRISNLQQTKIADDVFLLPEDFGDPLVRDKFIRFIHPDILAVSSHTPHQAEKKQLVEKYGGQLLVVTQHDPNFSSTKIILEKGMG